MDSSHAGIGSYQLAKVLSHSFVKTALASTIQPCTRHSFSTAARRGSCRDCRSPRPLLLLANFVAGHRQRRFVGIAGIGVVDFSLRLVELRLADLDNAAQADLELLPCPAAHLGRNALPLLFKARPNTRARQSSTLRRSEGSTCRLPFAGLSCGQKHHPSKRISRRQDIPDSLWVGACTPGRQAQKAKRRSRRAPVWQPEDPGNVS